MPSPSHAIAAAASWRRLAVRPPLRPALGPALRSAVLPVARHSLRYYSSQKDKKEKISSDKQSDTKDTTGKNEETTDNNNNADPADQTPDTAYLRDSLKNIPLPDLTKGLPSTIFTELEQQQKKSRPSLPNLTEDPDYADYDPATSAGAGGGKGKSPDGPEYVSSTDRRRDKMASASYAFLWTSLAALALYLGRDWPDAAAAAAHPDAPAGWTPQRWWRRLRARYRDITAYYADPPFRKLLPDEDAAQRQPYTLVLSLEDLLVHNEWTREHGWRLAKRPGVDYFLRYLNQYFELVLFTSVPVMQADQVLRKLDPFRIIRWPLGREAARYEKGEYIKDLSYLNRDLSKTIIIDTLPAHVQSHPENAILLPKWSPGSHDADLVALIPFLEYIAGVGIDDVRPVLRSFEGKHVPTEFARRERLMRQKHAEQVAAEAEKRPRRSVAAVAGWLGVKPAGGVGGDGGEGKMILDLIRERGQKNYEFMDREIRENGPKWLAEMEAEEEKARQMQMQSMKQGFFGSLGLAKGEKNEGEEKK